MTTADYEALADHFGVRESIIENLHEEFEQQVANGYTADEYSDFFIYLVREFSQAAFLYSAENGEDIIECLEAFDTTWDSLTEGLINDGVEEEAACG